VARGKFEKNPQLDPIATPLETGVAWAAGIYEGEGCITRHGRTGYVACRVSQKDPWLLYKLQRWFGGSVREYTVRKFKSPATYFLWTVTGDRADKFINTIKSYLSPRRVAQVEAAYG
jgi:hypothetical protein